MKALVCKLALVVAACVVSGCAKVESASETFESTPAGLLGSGQIVRISENRAAAMSAPSWIAGGYSGVEYKVAGSAPGVIAWDGSSCSDVIRGCQSQTDRGLEYSGISGSGDGQGPVWDSTPTSQYGAFAIRGSTVLFPHDAIPSGKWQITARFAYGIVPRHVEGVMPDFGGLDGHASASLRCVYGTSGSRIEGARVSKGYSFEGQSWQTDLISFVSPPTTLSDCKSEAADAHIEITFSIGDAKRAQFNWIELSMAPVH